MDRRAARVGAISALSRLYLGYISTGGLLVSALLKYTSSALKNFAAPLGIILNCLIARRPRYSRDTAETQPRFSRDSAEIQPRRASAL